MENSKNPEKISDQQYIDLIVKMLHLLALEKPQNMSNELFVQALHNFNPRLLVLLLDMVDIYVSSVKRVIPTQYYESDTIQQCAPECSEKE